MVKRNAFFSTVAIGNELNEQTDKKVQLCRILM
jgi:hypothetical protein